MGWQKTFTLAKRGKGCHLVTEEVLSHIQSGLRDVQVDTILSVMCAADRLLICAGWDALSVHVGQIRILVPGER